jgi:lysyl-tRNA synthetase class 2
VLPAEIEEPVAPLPAVAAEVEAVPAAPAVPEQTRVRLAKLDALRTAGVDPYPPGFARTRGCGEVRAAYAELAPGTATDDRVAVAGRVVLLRDHGKLWFATLRDWSGDVQVMLAAEVLGNWKNTVDLGDHVGVAGEVITSRRGEVTVRAESWTLTAKCLHPLPDKHRGLADPEALVRQRYLDLIVNPAVARAAAGARRRGARAAHHPGRPGVPGGRDPDPPAHPRGRQRPAVHHPQQRLRHAALPADRAGAVPEAAGRRRGRAGYSSWAATSATRAWTPRTTPSSRCWRRTRRTATTARCGR